MAAGFAFFKGGEKNRNPPPKKFRLTNHLTNKTNMVIAELIEEFHVFLIKCSDFRVFRDVFIGNQVSFTSLESFSD